MDPVSLAAGFVAGLILVVLWPRLKALFAAPRASAPGKFRSSSWEPQPLEGRPPKEAVDLGEGQPENKIAEGIREQDY